MSNLIVEGFGTYGIGTADSSTPVGKAMLAGAWADAGTKAELAELPWDSGSGDVYLGVSYGAVSGGVWAAYRRVLPAVQDELGFSFYYAVSNLPDRNGMCILEFRDDSNNLMGYLTLNSTGALAVRDGSGATLATTSGPVIVAETATHVECRVKMSTGEFDLWVGGTKVIAKTGLSFTGPEDIAQFAILRPISNNVTGAHYMSHLIVRDSAATFPIGDRKVATLFPNNDVSDEQGWTARPLHRFGVGILDLTPNQSFVAGEISTETDIGANEFTIEGQFRFRTLPTGDAKAVLFGKWDEPHDRRSYQLYLGGPDLENGLLTFRTSTDGANGTVENKLQWKWEPVIGRWYHIAMVRADGDLFLFIDGVQAGVTVADSDTYYAGNAVPALGAQTDGSSYVGNTAFYGWQDEFRLTIGAARYTANFTPPTEGFPRSGDDAQWGSVKWLSSWDNDAVADDGPESLSLSPKNDADTLTPNDGEHAYQTIDERAPSDDDFIEAELIAAQGTFTLSAVPTAAETVTVGTTDGSTAAVYKFVSALSAAYDVLIGATVGDTMDNLAAAINGGSGEGTVYGTDTEANADVSGEVQPSDQLVVTALTPGTVGNSIDSTETCANGSWGAATLSGGVDIPDPSQFKFERMPANTTVVDSVTLVARQWRNEAGAAATQVSFVGADGGVSDGNARVLGNTPSLTFDTFEADPDGGSLTPTSILLGKFQLDRTV